LTNVSKHAQATQVHIDLSLAGGVLSLEISDNGRGLNQEDLAKVRSFGIRGLHERAGTVGGWVDLSSGPAGTTLILSVPLGPEPDTGVDLELSEASDDEPAEGAKPYDPTVWGAL
jgi:glucose-6-phosphate-specific signal transduction histidine kinase